MHRLSLKERMLAKQRTADRSSKHSSPRDLYQQEEVDEDEDYVDPGGSPAAGGVYEQDDELVFLGESKKGRRGRSAGNSQHKQHSSPRGSAAQMEQSSSFLVPDVNPDDLVDEEFYSSSRRREEVDEDDSFISSRAGDEKNRRMEDVESVVDDASPARRQDTAGDVGGSPRTPESEDDEPNVGVFSPSRGSFVLARGIVCCREEVVVSSRYCWVGISR